MITLPMKCKICGKIISSPDEALIIGQPPQVRNQHIIKRLMNHMNARAEEEARKIGPKPHAQGIMEALMIAQNFNGALVLGNFELPPDTETERLEVISRVHEMTRQVRMSDEDLDAAWDRETEYMHDRVGSVAIDAAKIFFRDLRDRYESLGKYAPAQPAPAAPEEVKR